MRIGWADDPALAGRISALVNEVYAVAEEGLWLDGAARTSSGEVAELIRSGEIAVAWEDGEVVGSVRIQRLSGEMSEFGMLAADPLRRGVGIGRSLVRFAEETSPAPVMQLELLMPREWTHPVKKTLKEWYERLGYRVTRRGQFEDDYPRLAPLLATPCDYLLFHKTL